jgi:hypothetical protein
MNTALYLRDLAKRQLELAHEPENEARRQRWYRHNALQGEQPVIVFEEDTCWQDFYTPQCEDPDERFLESQMLQTIRAHECVADDKVIPDTVQIPVRIEGKLLGVDRQRKVAAEGLGFHDEPVLVNLEEDLGKLSPTVFHFDEAATRRLESRAQDLLGDVLSVRRVNTTNRWHFTPTQHVVSLMGMENMFYAMYDTPEAFHALMRLIIDDMKRLLRWEEKNGLLFANAGNDYMGSGSFCFNRELAQEGAVRAVQTWGHMNSQETVSISPDMYAEFIFPYYAEMAREFGLLYYGCCEPTDPIWDSCLSTLPNLRKLSISPWCDEEKMAERLAGKNVIYSRKPSPNFLGVTPAFDEEAFTASIQKTVELTRGCHVEYIFRDIYTLHGNTQKARRAVEIVRRLTEARG